VSADHSPRFLPRRAIVASNLALLAVVGLSALVGFLGSEEGFDWELAAVFGTALGTTLLAMRMSRSLWNFATAIL
jgi:hypothetical protein